MTEPPSDEETRKWHRRFAVDCNNRAWRLSEGSRRSAQSTRFGRA